MESTKPEFSSVKTVIIQNPTRAHILTIHLILLIKCVYGKYPEDTFCRVNLHFDEILTLNAEYFSQIMKTNVTAFGVDDIIHRPKIR